MNLESVVELNNGVKMPWVGFGVFLTEPGREVEESVASAIEIGYRHIDTAAYYENEAGVGKSLRASGVPRERFFVTTKVWNSDQGYERTLKAFAASKKALGLDYIDLYLVHWPVRGLYTDSYRAMEKLYREGEVRAIGVSNFLVHHIEHLTRECQVVPAVNQIEFHPFLQQPELLAYCRGRGIQVEAWSPLTRGRRLDHSVIVAIAAKHSRSPAQILLRWDLQRQIVTIPKSVHAPRIRENSQLFDFELDADDMQALDGLDEGSRIGPDPDTF
ncbi:MAG TPA: aldo/keto reductase [Spirochaetia bacterium]|nr:aldo/keto reductase [Spirochaetia bacterium]